MNLQEIRKPVKEELKEFNKYFNKILSSNHELIKFITNIFIRQKGKQIRPLLVFLSAKINGEINEKTYTGAALVELLHTATLVHDDVVDNSELRRNTFSIKALWKAKIAVLFGDYLLAKGLLTSVEKGAMDLLELTSEAVEKMVEGELKQLKRSRLVNIDINEYFEIIESKTASLMAAACAIGAKSTTNDKDKVLIMKELGRNIGICFQIKDDILDIEKSAKSGKQKANDIIESKITLPLILALEQSNSKEKRSILKLLHKKEKKYQEINEIIKFIVNKNGIKLAYDVLNEYKNKSLAILNQYPESPALISLQKLIDFITVRNF